MDLRRIDGITEDTGQYFLQIEKRLKFALNVTNICNQNPYRSLQHPNQ